MNVIFSATSSKGNTSVIESGDGHLIVIDAGIKYKTVDKEIGYRLHTADALLITHNHNDHTKYLKEYKYIQSIYLPYEAMEHFVYWGLIDAINSYQLSIKDKIFTDSFIISPLEMEHTNSDGTSCECFGFLILDKSTGEKMLWATDTQYIKNKFPPLDFYCIESNFFEKDNYDGELDCITKVVEQRRVQSHMSFESAVMFLKQQDLSKCKEIRLLHLSSSISEEDKKKMKTKLRSEIRSQIKGRKVKIIV